MSIKLNQLQTEFEKKLMKENPINIEKKSDIKKDSTIHIKNEFDLIKDIVLYGHKEIEKQLIDREKNGLKIAGKFLEKYGFLEEEIQQQNEDYKRLDFKNMCYKYETEGITEDIGLKNIFTDEYIDTLSFMHNNPPVSLAADSPLYTRGPYRCGEIFHR